MNEMMPPDGYKVAKLSALESTVAARDSAPTEFVIASIRADGYDEWAREVMATPLLKVGA